MLCVELGLPGVNLNADIGTLVRKGLPPEVQQALDTVRVIGNNAVHPGQIDIDDNPEVANRLFGLVNFIVDRMISHPKQIEAFYGALPEKDLTKIAKRDRREP